MMYLNMQQGRDLNHPFNGRITVMPSARIYCVMSVMLVGVFTYTQANSVGGKQNLYDNTYNDNNNNVITSSKLFDRPSLKIKYSTKTLSASHGKSSYNFDVATTTTDVLPSVNITNSQLDSLSGRQKTSKGGGSNWWSQIEVTKDVSQQQEKKSTKNTTKSKNESSENSNDNHNGQEAGLEAPKQTSLSKSDNNGSKSTATATTTSQQDDSGNRPTKQFNKSMATVNNLSFQWASVKQKQRTLLSVSMQELKNLDAKLIKTYKQCQKRRLDFFGGMLYRTRDFVVRLYKDAKSERKTLESVAKQIDTTMKRIMVNNNIQASDISPRLTMTIDNDSRQLNQTTDDDTTKSNTKSDNNNGDTNKSVNKRQIANGGGGVVSIKQETSYVYTKTSSSTSSLIPQNEEPPSVANAPIKSPSALTSTKSVAATKESFKVRNISDVKLRRQLDHAQALIDRIHKSSAELSSIVDDIIYVFKLDGYRNKEKTSSLDSTDNKNKGKRKSSFKSPIKIFMERYGNIFQAPKKPQQDLQYKYTNSSGRVSQQLIDTRDYTNSSSNKPLTLSQTDLNLDTVTSSTMNESIANNLTTNSSSMSISSNPLTPNLNSNNNSLLIDTGESSNGTSILDEDIGFGETSTVLTILEIGQSISANTTVYHLETTNVSS